MNRYIVTLQSKDGCLYEFKTYGRTENEAIESAIKNIEDKHWDIYEYKFKDIQRIKSES